MGRLSVDSYLMRNFDLRRENCWHLARDAWRDLTGVDLGDRTPERITSAALIGRFDSDVPSFTKLDAPADPCIVLMRSPGVVPHVGIYHRRRVLQLTRNGPSFASLPMATNGYDSVEFYR